MACAEGLMPGARTPPRRHEVAQGLLWRWVQGFARRARVARVLVLSFPMTSAKRCILSRPRCPCPHRDVVRPRPHRHRGVAMGYREPVETHLPSARRPSAWGAELWMLREDGRDSAARARRCCSLWRAPRDAFESSATGRVPGARTPPRKQGEVAQGLLWRWVQGFARCAARG